MNRSRTVVLALAALAFVAIALSATSLETASSGPLLDRPDDGSQPGAGQAATPSAEASKSGDSGGEEQQREPETGDRESPNPADGVSPVAVLGGLIALVCTAAVLAYRATGGDPAPDSSGEGPDTGPDPDASMPPASAERAVPATNDVYRAWWRFEQLLGDRVGPGRSPAKLARAGREAGLPGAAIGELCEVYCDVRYGGQPATEDRERRAREAIERISGQEA